MMRNKPYYQILSVLVAILFCFDLTAQTVVSLKKDQNSSKQWKPVILKDLNEILIAPPPGAAATQKEIEMVKKQMSMTDENTMQKILYWDAGAPSYRWNEMTYKLITFEDPHNFFRFPSSWVNLAIYDATVLAWEAKLRYDRKRPSELDKTIKPIVESPMSPSYPCEHTVTAAAAATVLAYFYPSKADSVLSLAKEASQSRINAGLQFPSDVAEAWKLGTEVAAKVIALAKKDGAGIPFKGQIPTDPNLWKGPYPVGIHVGNYKPFFMTSANQFRPPAPPDFSKDMKELNEFKRDTRSDLIALYWASLTGVDYWTELASKKIFEYRLDRNTMECARIYAVLHTAMYDAGIAIMEAKYAYWGTRPFLFDKNFTPLIPTPPFPGYPSGHATASSTAATVLAYFFPADAEFFKEKARECAESRFYAGIHFRTDNETGLVMGEKLANYVIQQWKEL